MTTKLREHYDWVTFGDHPAAILSAAMVARLGLSAIIVPLEKSKVIDREQILDLEPGRIDGLGKIGLASGLWRGAIERLTTKRGAEGFWEKISELKMAREVVTPHDRVGVATDADLFAREFAREWSVDGAALSDALKRADRAFGRYIEKWFEAFRLRIENGKSVSLAPPRLDECLNDEFKGAPASARALLRSRKGFADVIGTAFPAVDPGRVTNVGRAFELPDAWLSVCFERSGAAFRGGMGAFREALLKIAVESGAQIASDEVCRRIDVEGGRNPKLRSFMLSGLPNPILATAGAFSGTSEQLVEAIRESSAAAIPSVVRPSPAAWRFTLAFTLHREAIPVSVPARITIQDLEGPPLELEWANAEDYGVDEPEHVLLFARTPVPFERETLSVEWQRKLAARIMRKAAAVFPFIEFHVARISPDFRKPPEGGPERDEFSGAYGFAALELIPENLRIYPSIPSKSGFRSGVDGLFRVGPSSYPEWGSLGALRSAIESVAWFAHKNGLPGPFGP